MSSTVNTRPVPRRTRPPKAQIVVGSITEAERTKRDGTAYTAYRAQYYSPLDGTSRIRRQFSNLQYGTKRKAKLAAETWLGKQRAAMAAGTWVDPREPVKVNPGTITIAEVAEQWAASWNDRPLAAKTQLSYRSLLSGRVLPHWGKRRVGSITSQDVQEWVRALAKSKPLPGNNHKSEKSARVHPTTVRRAYAVLQLTLRYAVRQGWLDKNPCNAEAIELPSTRKAKKVGMHLTWSELRELVAAMPEHWRLPTALAVTTGVRRSELWGLTRADWDSQAGVIRIRQTLTYIDGEFIAAPGKTEASRRL